jgi:hypothetical protein
LGEGGDEVGYFFKKIKETKNLQNGGWKMGNS